MKKEKMFVTMDDKTAMFSAVLVVPFVAFFAALSASDDFFNISGDLWVLLVCALALLAAIPHELIHAAGWKVCERKIRVHFGVRFPFCAYTQFDGVMRRASFFIGCLLPFIVTSVVPMAVGTACGNKYLFIFGVLESVGCGSDLLSCIRIFTKTRRGDLIADEKGITGFVVLR